VIAPIPVMATDFIYERAATRSTTSPTVLICSASLLLISTPNFSSTICASSATSSESMSSDSKVASSEISEGLQGLEDDLLDGCCIGGACGHGGAPL
jgi:hypothetical protein